MQSENCKLTSLSSPSKKNKFPGLKFTLLDLPTTQFVTFFVCLGKFSSEQVLETMVLLCTLLFFSLARNIIRYLCRTACLLVDLCNRKKVFTVTLGQVQTSYFTWAESNANKQNPLFSLICIRFGSCEVRRLNRALALAVYAISNKPKAWITSFLFQGYELIESLCFKINRHLKTKANKKYPLKNAKHSI